MSMHMATRRSKAMAGSRAELYRMVSVAVQTVPDAFVLPLQRPVWLYVNSMDLELSRQRIADSRTRWIIKSLKRRCQRHYFAARGEPFLSLLADLSFHESPHMGYKKEPCKFPELVWFT